LTEIKVPEINTPSIPSTAQKKTTVAPKVVPPPTPLPDQESVTSIKVIVTQDPVPLVGPPVQPVTLTPSEVGIPSFAIGGGSTPARGDSPSLTMNGSDTVTATTTQVATSTESSEVVAVATTTATSSDSIATTTASSSVIVATSTESIATTTATTTQATTTTATTTATTTFTLDPMFAYSCSPTYATSSEVDATHLTYIPESSYCSYYSAFLGDGVNRYGALFSGTMGSATLINRHYLGRGIVAHDQNDFWFDFAHHEGIDTLTPSQATSTHFIFAIWLERTVQEGVVPDFEKVTGMITGSASSTGDLPRYMVQEWGR
jgi:hypothetical protein